MLRKQAEPYVPSADGKGREKKTKTKTLELTSFFQLRPRKCSATCAGKTFSSRTRLRFSMVSISSHSLLNLSLHRKSNLQ